ncbi:MAG: 16S rRNA (uracil(1498)-N(3))-methyltransferase [Ardenticatenaceae bacterium]
MSLTQYAIRITQYVTCNMHRFFISPELIEGSEVLFPSDLAHQISRVLRLREDDRVVILDNSDMEREVRLHSFSKRAVRGTVEALRQNRGEPRTYITLYMALLKGKKLDVVFQKGTELGASRFVPLVTQRSVVGFVEDLSDARLDRWQAIVREAAEQSGRGRLPEVVDPLLFDVALAQARTSQGVTLIPWEKGGKSLKSALRPVEGRRPERINLFIGPEGGFEEDEILTARAYGAIPVTLGPRILRAETAAIAALAAILYELGEWEAGSVPEQDSATRDLAGL